MTHGYAIPDVQTLTPTELSTWESLVERFNEGDRPDHDSLSPTMQRLIDRLNQYGDIRTICEDTGREDEWVLDLTLDADGKPVRACVTHNPKPA